MFVVEDGTSVPDANAYVDIPYIEGYLMGDRLARFMELTDEEKEAAIIAASQLIDISYQWKGRKADPEQGLSWPRIEVEVDGYEITGIPPAIRKAVGEAVWLVMTEESLYSTEADKTIASEKIDVIQTSYFNPKDGAKETQTRFEILDLLVKHLITETKSGGSSIGSAQVVRV
jgi:hypothetical protein